MEMVCTSPLVSTDQSETGNLIRSAIFSLSLAATAFRNPAKKVRNSASCGPAFWAEQVATVPAKSAATNAATNNVFFMLGVLLKRWLLIWLQPRAIKYIPSLRTTRAIRFHQSGNWRGAG